MTATLKIIRLRNRVFAGGVFKIFLDDEFVSYIANSDSKLLLVEEGQHTLRVSLDWLKSNSITFNVASEGFENFVISADNFNILTIYKIMFYTLLFNLSPPGRVLYLTRESSLP